MADGATPYRLGDVLAIARASWVRKMAEELARRGYPGYHATDAAVVRLLMVGPSPVGRLGEVLGTTRQAARKAVAQLERRGFAITSADPRDGRKVNVALTPEGIAYSRAVSAVIRALNRRVAATVSGRELAAADKVLRACLHPSLAALASAIPAPPVSRS